MVVVKPYTYPAVDATATDAAHIASLVDRLQKHDIAAVELSTKLRRYISAVQIMDDAGRDLCSGFVNLFVSHEEEGDDKNIFSDVYNLVAICFG